MKRSKTSKQWMKEHVNDAFVQRARSEGYRSRAAYKLMEIAAKDKLFRRGMTVVDLGAAPGGWTQVACAGVQGGTVIALDILDFTPVPGATLLKGDFLNEETLLALDTALDGRKVDLVLSDMSPNISGIAISDQARAMALAEAALEFADDHLKPGGSFLVKVFQGSGFQEFFRLMQSRYTSLATRKPAASRGRSSELYLLGKGHKGDVHVVSSHA